MKNYHNIESRRNPTGPYTGHIADGRAWRIMGRTGCWSAYANVTKSGSINQILMYDRLAEISAGLESIK